MTEDNQNPAPVSPWPEQQAQREHFDALVKEFEAKEQTAADTPPVQVDERLAAILDEAQAGTDASGRRFYGNVAGFAEHIEHLRRDLYAGKKFDVETERQKIADLLGVRVSGEPDEADYVSAGEVAGVHVEMPEGVTFDSKDPLLNGFVGHAKAAGLDDRTINAAIHAFIASLPDK